MDEAIMVATSRDRYSRRKQIVLYGEDGVGSSGLLCSTHCLVTRAPNLLVSDCYYSVFSQPTIRYPQYRNRKLILLALLKHFWEMCLVGFVGGTSYELESGLLVN